MNKFTKTIPWIAIIGIGAEVIFLIFSYIYKWHYYLIDFIFPETDMILELTIAATVISLGILLGIIGYINGVFDDEPTKKED